MLSKVIGIISYLPDDKQIRHNRFNKLSVLINKIKQLFKTIPVIIVAQNWSEEDLYNINNIYDYLMIYPHEKLGITGARKELRNIFLNKTSFDYLIMIDDDIELIGNSAESYLNQIDSNPDCFIENNKSRLQLFAISRYILSKHDFNDIEAERGEGFEDRIFFYTLCKKFPEAHKKFRNTGIIEKAIATGDKDSTWYKDQNLKEMLEKTQVKIEELA